MIDTSMYDGSVRLRPGLAFLGRALPFSVVWATAIALLVVTNAYLRGEPTGERLIAILYVFSGGAFAGGIVAYGLASLIARYRKEHSARFAAMILALGVSTYGMAALLFFLQFRIYFSQWHDPLFSPGFFLQNFVTLVTGSYLLLTWGLYHLMPGALLMLFVSALWFVRTQHNLDRPD